MTKKILLLTAFSVLILSCAPTVNYASFDGIGREAKKESKQIDVFTTPTSIPYKFKEIGLVSVEYPGRTRNDADILNMARNKAGNMGADGIIYLNEKNITTNGIAEYNSTFQHNIVKFSAIVRLQE